MACLYDSPELRKLQKLFSSESRASVRNMVGVWQEREMRNGNKSITQESVPDVKTLSDLYSELRESAESKISLDKEELDSLLDDKKLPDELTNLADRLGVSVKVNRRSHTIEISSSVAKPDDLRLFRALAIDYIYKSDEAAKAFDMSPRERLAAIIDWEDSHSNSTTDSLAIMNYELQYAKKRLNDDYGITTDGIIEQLRKRAAEAFTSKDRQDRIFEIVDWFDRILTSKHEGRLQELADRRDELNEAKRNKDRSKSNVQQEVTSAQEAKARLLNTKVSDLGLSVRAFNRLKDKKIETIADIVQYNRTTFARIANLSGNALKEIIDLVDKLGLSFGMDISDSQVASWEAVEAEYDRELEDIQHQLSSYTRLKALDETTPQVIFDEIRQKFERLASLTEGNTGDFIDAVVDEFEVSRNFVKNNVDWFKDQVQKVLDNFEVLTDEACKELETSELIRINLRFNDVEDRRNNKLHEEENEEGESESDAEGVENQYKENWMYEFDTVSAWSRISARVRHMLYKVPLDKRKTRFGTQRHMPVMQVVNTLLREFQGVTTSREMDQVLEVLAQDEKWVDYIREQLAQDSQLKTQFFRSMRKYGQSLGIIQKSSNKADRTDMLKNKLMIINSAGTVNSIFNAVRNQILSGVPVNRKVSIFKDTALDQSSIEKVIDYLDKYTEDEWKEIINADPSEVYEIRQTYPDLLSDLHYVLTALGFQITQEDLRMISIRNTPKGVYRQKNNLGFLAVSANFLLKQLLEHVESGRYETTEDLITEPRDLISKSVMRYYQDISKALTLVDNGAVEPSTRENGKVRHTYVLPSALDDLILGFQGKRFSHVEGGRRVNYTIQEFINKKYGQDPRFAYTNEDGEIHYRNHILEALVYGEGDITVNGLGYVTIVDADTTHKDKAEQKDLTQNDRLNMMWVMYNMDDTYPNAEGTWFNIPLPSDSGRMAYIRFEKTTDEEDVRGIVKDAILKELERMTEDDESIIHLPQTYRNNKSKFCTFEVLNEPKLNGGYKVSEIIDAYITANNTDQFLDFDDLMEKLIDSVLAAMVGKFKAENKDFYDARVRESSENSVNARIYDMGLFQMAMNELLNGDPAYYTGYNKGSDNIQKRAKGPIVPVDHIDIYNEDFLESYKSYHGIDPDTELEEDDIVEHCLYIEDPKMPSPSSDDLIQLYTDAYEREMIDEATYNAFINSIKSIKHTDGQSFRAFESMRMMMYALGEMRKGDDLDLALGRIAEGRQQPGDSEVVRTALKPFVDAMVPITQPDGTVRLMPVQHKLSEQILTAALLQARGTKLNNPALNALGRVMNEHGIDVAIFSSGVKKGQNGAVNFGDVDPESASEDAIYQKINSEIEGYQRKTGISMVHQIPYSFYGIVAQNPDSGLDESEVPIGTQLQKLISADLPDEINVKYYEDGEVKLRKEKAKYYVDGVGELTRDEIRSLYNKLMTRMIMNAYKDVVGTFADKKKLSEALMRSCRNSSRNSSYLERAFSLDEHGNFVIPLCDLATLNMSSEFLNSIVRNAVARITTKGKQLVSMSAFGFAKELKIEFEYDEDGNPVAYKAIECLLPAWSRHIISKCSDENGILDFSKLEKVSPNLAYAIGVRIPTQFKNFILPLKCVGFLPTILGDTIVTAIDSVVLQDADFDNDKVPTIFPRFSVDKYEDGWEDKLKDAYHQYEREYYDMDKLNNDYDEFLNQLKDDGIKGGYSKGKFIRERLQDPDFEPKYRKKDAPEGKPMTEREFNALHKKDYLRKDGPKLEYVTFDPEIPLEDQSEDALINGLINVMRGLLTAPAVSAMSLAAGDTSRLDPIIETLKKYMPQPTYPDSPSDISTRITQETRNNDGKQMIAVFANAEAIQSLLQYTKMALKPGRGVTINGRTLHSLHEVKIEGTLEYISRLIGTDLGASADNAKDPKLYWMNINLRTAPVVSIMLQLGYKMEEIAFFLNIPSIRHYTDTGNFDSYTEPDMSDLPQVLSEGTEKMLRAIHAGDNYNDMDDDIAEYCDTALGVYMYLNGIGERMRKLASLSRGDSGGSAPHGPIENNLVRALNYELFAEMEAEDPLFDNWRDMANYNYDEDVSQSSVDNASNPIQQAYIEYGVVGAFKALSKYYPGLNDPKFRKVILDIIKKYYGGVATVYNVKNVMYSLYNYIESSYDCMKKEGLSMEESRNYYMNIFPEEAAQIISKYPSIANSLLFRTLRLYSTIETDGDPFIRIEYDGTMLPETRDEFTATWQQLFYAKNEDGTNNDELQQLALDLFKYCYFRNGFRFTNGSFAHLAPAEARLMFPGYIEMLRSMLQGMQVGDYSNFEIQFLRNNLYSSRFCRTIPMQDAKPSGWNNHGEAPETLTMQYKSAMDDTHRKAYSAYFNDGENTPINAFLITKKTENGKLQYLYYIKTSDNDVKRESTYTLVTPLGFNDKAVEYSATEGGLEMQSAYDQGDVAKAVKTKNRRKKVPENTAKSTRDSKSSGEPNESRDEWEDYRYKGFWASSLTGSGYEMMKSWYPDVAKSKKYQDARKAFLAERKKSGPNTKTSAKTKAKSKEQVAKEKRGGNKSSRKFKLITSTEKADTVIAAEKKCATQIGAYTLCVTDNTSDQLRRALHNITPRESQWVPELFDPKNAYDIAEEMRKKLARKQNKSIVLNLTGSTMNTMSRYTTQEDLDAYVLKIYQALKDKGIYVSKVVSTAQPGIPLASARAAMKLGYSLEIYPTSDYKVYDSESGKFIGDRDKFLANLDEKLASKDYQKSARVYDKEDGPFIIAQNDWTRDIVAKDKRTIYVFEDNGDRTSGRNRLSSTTKYAKLHGGLRLLNYPDSGSATARGLENAFPLTLQKKNGEKWEDKDLKEFKRVISADIDAILEAFKDDEYRRVVLPVGGILDSEFGDITKERTPKLYDYLVEQMERLSTGIEDISDTETDESEDENIYEPGFKTDKNEILGESDIQYTTFAGKVNQSNLYVIEPSKLPEGVSIEDESGETISENLFIILPKGEQKSSSDMWKKGKIYSSSGHRIIDDIYFTLPSRSTKYDLLEASVNGLSLALTQNVAKNKVVTDRKPLNQFGLTWLDDNNQSIC